MPRKITLDMLDERATFGFILAFVQENSLEDCIINDGPCILVEWDAFNIRNLV
ncbi:hypothetical protein C8J56DRAFT_1166915 [Mycena floridula]|nr:hypothetical protein C8J56DRAFT_1166915 [Mycena floridula]